MNSLNNLISKIDDANDEARFNKEIITNLYELAEKAHKYGVIFDTISCYEGDAIELTAIQAGGEKRQLIVDSEGFCLLVWFDIKGKKGKSKRFVFDSEEIPHFITVFL